MANGDDQQVLAALHQIATELVKIGAAVDTSAKGIAELLRRERQPMGRGNGQAWAIATFVTVILALGTIFTRQASHNSKISELRSSHQTEITMLLAQHQEVRVHQLDDKLQKEIAAAENLYRQAEMDSAHRHETQQREFTSAINEIRSYFKPPKLRDNDRNE